MTKEISTRVGPTDDYAELAQVFRDLADGVLAVLEVDALSAEANPD